MKKVLAGGVLLMTAMGAAVAADGPAAAPEEFVPAWAKEVVWYQIFPERFRNGDPANDPTKDDIAGAFPDDPDLPWGLHPWTSDWYERQAWEKDGGEWSLHDLLQRRRYGGDLQGIIDKLDYLQDLGITALYLNPIFESPSLHKYDGVSYHHVDPNLGPDPEGDRELIRQEVFDDPSTWVWTSADKLALKLIKEAHARGMRVIFDGVFNHMGVRSIPFQDLVENQQNSRFKDWFTVLSWDDPEKGTKFDYEGWFGHKTLPEFREDENGIVDGPREYIFAATRRWMDPDGDGDPGDGIDGWRLDVAFCVAHPFWKDWRKVVKETNPEAYLTAEVIEPIPDLQPYLEGDEFDAVMNYNFAFACADYFVDEKNRIKTSEFNNLLKELREAFPPGVDEVQQNLFSSHDTNRLGSHIVNRDRKRYRDWGEYFGFSQVQNGLYDPRKPTPEELEVQKLFAIFQMTYVGAPMIYYGDEVGMWGANDPCCRKPMVWEDMEYDDEVWLPDGTRRDVADKVGVNSDLFDHYRKLIHLRNELPALRTGSFSPVVIDDTNEIYAFSRRLGDDEVLVALNNSEKPREVMLDAGGIAVWKERLAGKDMEANPQGRLTLKIPPRSGAILTPGKAEETSEE